jgi:hypothetical protein
VHAGALKVHHTDLQLVGISGGSGGVGVGDGGGVYDITSRYFVQ